MYLHAGGERPRPASCSKVTKFRMPPGLFHPALLANIPYSATQGRFVAGKVHIHPKHFVKGYSLGLSSYRRLAKRDDRHEVCFKKARVFQLPLFSKILPNFASEVYGFLDREYVGTSLIANRGLNELIAKLRHLLPVHHLACDLHKDVSYVPPPPSIRHVLFSF